jgi:hypothetical protein
MVISIGLFRFDAAVADAGLAGIGGDLGRGLSRRIFVAPKGVEPFLTSTWISPTIRSPRGVSAGL